MAPPGWINSGKQTRVNTRKRRRTIFWQMARPRPEPLRLCRSFDTLEDLAVGDRKSPAAVVTFGEDLDFRRRILL
jgi:hypothetical protein